MSIGILDTIIWADNMINTFWVELRDGENLAGNVTINVSKSVCAKSEETDKSMELRGNLKVVQSSFIIKKLLEEDKLMMVIMTTDAVYSVFNGVNDLKSVEFIGFRNPQGNTFVPFLPNKVTRQSNTTSGNTTFANTTFAEFGIQYFECLEGECIIMDLILTMYGLGLRLKDLNFDDSLHFGLIMAADMVQQQSEYEIRPARSVRPATFDGQDSIGAVLCAIAIIVFLASAFYNFFQSPSKSFLWKIRENLTLGLVTSSVYMETQERGTK